MTTLSSIITPTNILTTTSTNTVTNKTIDGANNTISNIDLATDVTGTLAQTHLANASLTVNGVEIALGGSNTITANAETLTGTSLNATVVSSSLTSVGTLSSLDVNGNITSGNLSSNNVTANVITMNTSAAVSVVAGQMAWNSADGTLDIGIGYGNVVLQTGQETHYVVRNATGNLIENGSALYCSGVTPSGRIEVDLMVGTIDPIQFLGLATMDITDGVNGVVTWFGYVRELDTRGTANTAISVGDETWAAGDKLFAHPTAPGKLTNIEPEAPNAKICVASIIIRNQTQGVLFVRPSTNLDISDHSDVQIDTPVNNEFLTYVGDRWENTALDISVDTSPALGGNLDGNGFNISNVGNITGAHIIGEGGNLSNIQGGNVSGTVASASTAYSVDGANVSGTVSSATVASSANSVDGANVSGQVANALVAGTVYTAAQPNITSVGTLTSLAVTGNVTTGNVSGTTVTATTLDAGNIEITGDTITSSHDTITIDPSTVGAAGLVVIAGNLQVTGTTTTIDSTVVTINDLAINVANNAATATEANGAGLKVGPVGTEYATWLYNQATSAWTTTLGITATGNISGGNVSGTTGAFTNVSGNGSALTSLTGANVTGTVPSATVAASANSVAGANVSGTVSSATTAGTVTTAAQANITSVGTLTSLAVTGNITSGNVSGTTGAFTNVTGNGSALTALNASNVTTGTLAQARLANAAVTLGSTDLTLGSTVTTVAGLTSVTSTTFVGALTGAATSATTAGTVTTAAQPNITSVGTLTSLAVTGALTTTQITTGANTTAGNITGNWTLTTGSKLEATYADLAEKYVADAHYEPGTVVQWGGEKELTMAETNTSRVAGVVSTNPAYIMNGECSGDHVVTLALQGRVPCRVTGSVRKGDMMVSAGNGLAMASATPSIGTVIGKAIENFDGDIGVIEIVVDRF